MRKSAQAAQQRGAATPLAPLNEALERTGSLPDVARTFQEWVWKSDPDEPFDHRVLLNRSHLLGLLVCRHAANKNQRAPSPPQRDERMTLVSKSPCDMSLRELRDTLDNLLIEWPKFVDRLRENPSAQDNVKAVAALVEGCLARLGQLAQTPGDAKTFDDASCTEPAAGGHMRMSRPGLRRMLGSFLIIFRHLDLLKRCKAAAEALKDMPQPGHSDQECGLRKHHVEASTDDFHLICMNMFLPVAAKLNYKQDFPGMYNHVSQVIYFHNTQYERTPRADIEEILRTGDPMQTVPAICQIHPELELTYEEDAVDLSGPTGKWRWLILPRRIYLVDPLSNVYHSESALELLRIYRASFEVKRKADRPRPEDAHGSCMQQTYPAQ